jgi:hypothetical protein
MESFAENQYFHIYCKAVGNNVLFKKDENKKYFLYKYAIYTNGYLETYAYCLLDNHVHWLVKCQSYEYMIAHLTAIGKSDLKNHQKKFLNSEISFEEELEFQLKDFFISYSLAFNKMYNRSGSLFINPFRRVLVNKDTHFTQLIIYIHANTLKHSIYKDFQNYKWSSYQSILSNKPSLVKRDEVMEWFGNRDEFIKVHKEAGKYYYENPFSIE